MLPFFNGGVVAAQQNLRNSQASEHVRLGIGGSLQQTVGKRFLHGRTLIPQHAGNQARYGVNYHHRGNGPVRENIVPDGQFHIHQLFYYTMVHPLIMTAEDNEMASGGSQFRGQ